MVKNYLYDVVHKKNLTLDIAIETEIAFIRH